MSDNNTFSVISIINNSDLKQLEEISSLVSEKIKELKIKEEIKILYTEAQGMDR